MNMEYTNKGISGLPEGALYPRLLGTSSKNLESLWHCSLHLIHHMVKLI